MKKTGFTLIEILIAMTILIVGMVGILALFPVGLNASRMAVEDSTAAIVAESTYASLRAAIKQMPVVAQDPVGAATNQKFKFFHDGVDSTKNEFALPLRDATLSMPGGSGDGEVATYKTKANPGGLDKQVYKVGQERAGQKYDIAMGAKDPKQLKQYKYALDIKYPAANPKGLYDVEIWLFRGAGKDSRLIKKFYTQIAAPPTD